MASLLGWVSAFLDSKPITSPRRIIEWQHWARKKLDQGWEVDAVKKRIRDSWDEWVARGKVDLKPLEPELQNALGEVFSMAQDGSTPEQCAVVYRSLARQYPERQWLADWARRWELMGEKWRPIS